MYLSAKNLRETSIMSDLQTQRPALMSPAQPPAVTTCRASTVAPPLHTAMSHHADLQAKQLLMHNPTYSAFQQPELPQVRYKTNLPASIGSSSQYLEDSCLCFEARIISGMFKLQPENTNPLICCSQPNIQKSSNFAASRFHHCFSVHE